MKPGGVWHNLWRSILPNLNKNSSATLKHDLKFCSRIFNTKMSMIQFAEKLKDILFFLMKQFHGYHAIIISSIPQHCHQNSSLNLANQLQTSSNFPNKNSNFTRLLHQNSVKARIFLDIMTRNVNALKKYSCQSTFLRKHCSTNTVVVHAYIMPAPYVTRLIKNIR